MTSSNLPSFVPIFPFSKSEEHTLKVRNLGFDNGSKNIGASSVGSSNQTAQKATDERRIQYVAHESSKRLKASFIWYKPTRYRNREDPAVLHHLHATGEDCFPGLGSLITHVDVSYDGKWILATTTPT